MQDVIEGKDYSFPKQEEHVLKFWEDTDAFKQQLKRSEGKKPYVFYDGPPFATGLPHYGHLLAGTLKVINTSQFAKLGSQASYLARRRQLLWTHARQATLRLQIVVSPVVGVLCVSEVARAELIQASHLNEHAVCMPYKAALG